MINPVSVADTGARQVWTIPKRGETGYSLASLSPIIEMGMPSIGFPLISRI